MTNAPLVSITIPSYNSEKMIRFCLEGVSKQTYLNIETLVLDSHSTDRTRDIAANYGIKVIECDGKLLAARYLGWKESKGAYIALVDTDQILEATTIERAVALMDDYDMLIFEEHSYNTEWLIPKLYSASRQMTNARFEKPYAFDPIKGCYPPRFFKRSILEKAFTAISKELIPKVIHGDHDIIYYESYKISKRVGIVPSAVRHVEPSWSKLWKTNYRYGASLKTIQKSIYWEPLMKKRATGGFSFALTISGLQARLLAMIFKVVQLIGYHFPPRESS